MQRAAALGAAVVVAVMAIAACFHHHGPLLVDATPERPALVSTSDEGPSACGLCAGNAATVAVALAPVPVEAPQGEPLRPNDAPADGAELPASGSPRSPPSSTAFAV